MQEKGSNKSHLFLFALNIKYLRKENNLNQTNLGEILGITRFQIRNFETLKSDPPLKHIIKMAEIFHISIDDLLFKNLSETEIQEKRELSLDKNSLPKDEDLIRILKKERNRLLHANQELEKNINELINMTNNLMDDNIEILEGLEKKPET